MRPETRAEWEGTRPGRPPFATACVAPWVSMEFDPAGWVYGCCTSHLYPLGRIGPDRLADLWGGRRSQVLRSALREGDLTVACGPCLWHLEHGRMDPVAAVYDLYPVTSDSPPTPYMMSFALSNHCNLACVMCNGELSSRIRSEQGEPPLVSPYDDAFFADLAPLLAGVRLVKFLGGEPFLVREHRRVWELMETLSNPPRQHVTTNGTVWTDLVDRVTTLFPTDISVSVDAATAETYARIRRGGDFDVVMRNLERFKARCDAAGTSLHVSYCLTVANPHELADFLAWATRYPAPASVNLVTEKGLALHDLPLEELIEVRSGWTADETRVGRRLAHNRPAWLTQIRQLDAVIAERRRGAHPAPRHALPAPDGWFTPLGPGPGDDWLPSQRRRLMGWSSSGAIAELRGSADGIITGVETELGSIGIDRRLVGTPLAALVDRLGAADGRTAWVVQEHAVQPPAGGQPRSASVMVRTLVLARERPVRGTPGLIVRTVQIPTRDGWTLLLAADTMYEEPDRMPPPPDPSGLSLPPPTAQAVHIMARPGPCTSRPGPRPTERR